MSVMEARVPQLAIPDHLSRVEEIKYILTRMDRLTTTVQELIAERIVAELAEGTRQRDLAAAIGKSQSYVSYMARAWELWSDPEYNHGYQTFSAVYHSPEVRQSRAVAQGTVESSTAAPKPKKVKPDAFTKKVIADLATDIHRFAGNYSLSECLALRAALAEPLERLDARIAALQEKESQ